MEPFGGRLDELFEQLVETPEPARESFFRTYCKDDLVLEAELRRLIAADADATEITFWRSSAIDLAEPIGLVTTLGAYRLESLIGSGGMGRVYRATRQDGAYDKAVAIKVLRPGFNAGEIIARFRTERQILANLEHPNIARLIDGGTDDRGLPYLVMEFIEGEPLGAFLASRHWSVRQRLRLFQSICAPVHYAHQRMVIHRDLKPGNILITDDGTPKLLDFGIAKLLGGADPIDAPALTPKYASPEQARGEAVTTASDVYSLGVILREMMANGETNWESLPRRDLEAIIAKALYEDAGSRYSSVDLLSQDVAHLLQGLPVEARGNSWAYITDRFLDRNRILVAAAAVLIVLLIGGIVVTRRAQARAERRFEDLRAIAHSVVFDYAEAMKKLPGTLPIRQRLVADALKYLDRLSTESGESPALERDLVDAYVQIASMQGDAYQPNLGDATGAMPIADKAITLGEHLIQIEANRQSLNSLAEAYGLRGDLLQSGGDLAGTEREWRKELALFERIAVTPPTGPKDQLQIAQMLWNLGDLYGSPGLANLGKLDQGISLYSRALDISRQVYAAHPEIPSAATRLYWSTDSLSQALAAKGEWSASMALAKELVQLGESIVADPAHKDAWRSNLSLGYDHLGRQYLAAADLPTALQYFRKAEQLATEALAADPNDVGLQRKLGIIEGYLSTALIRSEQPAAAVTLSLRSLQRMESLHAKDLANVDFRSDVATGHRRAAEALVAADRVGEAERHALAATSEFDSLTSQSPNSYFTLSHARSLMALGESRLSQHRKAEAIANFQQAGALLSSLHQRDQASALNQSEVAHAQWRLAEAIGHTELGESNRASAEANWNALIARNALSRWDRRERDSAYAQDRNRKTR